MLFCVFVLLVLAVSSLAADTTNVRPSPAQSTPATSQLKSTPNLNMSPTPSLVAPAPQSQVSSEGYQNDHGRGGHNGPPRGDYGNSLHGRRDRWRHDRYHGSWSFLIFHGPYVYPRPVYIPNVVRLPRYSADVYIEYAGNDVTGSDFVSALRDQLRREGLRLTTPSSDAALELYVVSMDEDPTDPGYGSAISVSYVWVPGYRFITAQLLDVGSQQVDDLAASVVSYTKQLLDDYR